MGRRVDEVEKGIKEERDINREEKTDKKAKEGKNGGEMESEVTLMDASGMRRSVGKVEKEKGTA